MKTPFFSIIIPTYNRSGLIHYAIESVLNQKFTNWELIIIDDGSDDNTQEVVGSYQDTRIKYFYQSNSERSAARNRGIKESKAHFICFLDSDDLYLSNHLSAFYDTIQARESSLAIFVTNGFFRRGKKEVTIIPIKEENAPIPSIWSTGLSPIFICINRSIFNECQFDESIYYAEDFKFVLEVLLRFPLHLTHQKTCILIDHKERTSNTQSLEQLRKMLQMKTEVKARLLNEYQELSNILPSQYLQKHQKLDYLFFAHKAISTGHLSWGRALLCESLKSPFFAALTSKYLKIEVLLLLKHIRNLSITLKSHSE